MEQGDAREPVTKEVRLLVPIEKSDSPQRVTYGVVLEPDTEDLQGDVMTAEDIEQAAYDWMERSQHGGRMHAGLVTGAKVVESYIAPGDIPVETADGTQTIKKGSWVLAMRWPPEIWESIQKGELTGYSVGGSGVRLEIEKHGGGDQSPHGNWARGPRPLETKDDIPGGGSADYSHRKLPWDRVMGEGDSDYAAYGAENFTIYHKDGQWVLREGGDGLLFSTFGSIEAAMDAAEAKDDTAAGGSPAAFDGSKWRQWGEGQRRLGNRLTIDNENEYAAAIRVQQHEGPDFFMTVTPQQAREILGNDREDAVRKHGSHDQSTHGNWARGGYRGDPVRDGAGAEGGGTPADQGAAAARREARGAGKGGAHKVGDVVRLKEDGATGRIVDYEPGKDGSPDEYAIAPEDLGEGGPRAIWVRADEIGAIEGPGVLDMGDKVTFRDGVEAKVVGVSRGHILVEGPGVPNGTMAVGHDDIDSDGNINLDAEYKPKYRGQYERPSAYGGGLAEQDDDALDGYPSGTVDDEQLYPTGGKWAGEDDSSDAEREEAEWKAGYGKDASQGWEAEAGYKTFTRGQKVRTPTGKIRTVHSQRGAQVFVEEESNGWYHPSKLWPVKKSAEDDTLEDAVRQGLRDAVAKHGSGDQSPHGNWARGGGQQTPRQRAWERHLTAPTPEERRRAGEDYVRYADAEDAAAVEGSGRASASDDRPLHEYAVGDKVEITYSRRDDPRELTATGQIRELERKSKFRYADHLVADLDDGGTIRFDDGRSNDIDLWSISRVSKHGSGDQSPHGNWARSKELGMVSIPDDDDSPARPEDEERDEELRRSRRTHTTRDGVAIEGQPKVQHIKNSEMFASGDGRVQLNYGEWKWTSAGQSRGVAKPPKLHERGHWGVWPRGADRSDTSKVIWGNGKTLAEFINSLDPGEYDLAT